MGIRDKVERSNSLRPPQANGHSRVRSRADDNLLPSYCAPLITTICSPYSDSFRYKYDVLLLRWLQVTLRAKVYITQCGKWPFGKALIFRCWDAFSFLYLLFLQEEQSPGPLIYYPALLVLSNVPQSGAQTMLNGPLRRSVGLHMDLRRLSVERAQNLSFCCSCKKSNKLPDSDMFSFPVS